MSIKDDLLDSSITAAMQKDDSGTKFTPSPMEPWVRVDKSPIEYFGARPETYLTKPPGHYLTGYEGSPCVRIEPVSVQWLEDKDEAKMEWFGATDLKHDDGGSYVGVKFKPQGIDTDEFRKQCEDIDKGE